MASIIMLPAFSPAFSLAFFSGVYFKAPMINLDSFRIKFLLNLPKIRLVTR